MVLPKRWIRVAGGRSDPTPARRVPCGTPMLLALMLWVCSLVLVGILILPLFGGRIAGVVGLGLLVFFVLACRAICAERKSLSG